MASQGIANVELLAGDGQLHRRDFPDRRRREFLERSSRGPAAKSANIGRWLGTVNSRHRVELSLES
jgi:hypothetical protein